MDTAADLIVGRDAELSTLRRLLVQLRDGRGGSVWIDGEAGIGKSMMARRLATMAREHGIRVYHATANELSESVALQPLLECLGIDSEASESQLVEIATIMGRAGTVPQGVADPILAATHRIIDVLENASRTDPSLFIFEDLQWSDSASIVAWQRLSRIVDQIPLVLVATRRPVPRRVDLDQLRRSQLADYIVDIELGPLSGEEVASLAGHLLGAAVAPHLRAELDLVGGNPLYVRELIDSLRRDGSLAFSGDQVEFRGTHSSVPATVGSAIEARLRSVTEETRQALRTAALLGPVFDVTDLSIVSGRTASALLSPLEEAMAAGIITDRGARLSFRHALLQQILYLDIAESERLHRHAAVAKALVDAGCPVERVAPHVLAAPDLAGDWTIDWLLGLPITVAVTAPGATAELLRQSVARVPPDDPRHDALAERLVRTLQGLRAFDDMMRAARTALPTARNPEVIGRLAWAAVYPEGELSDAAVGIVDAALRIDAMPARWRMMLRLVLSNSQYLRASRDGDEPGMAEARRWVDAVMDEAEHAQETLTFGFACHFRRVMSRTATRLMYTERALAVLGDDFESVLLRMVLLLNHMWDLDALGLEEQWWATARQTLIVAERAGSTHELSLRVTTAAGLYERGAWDDALAELEAVGSEMPPIERTRARGIASLITAHRGDWPAARLHLDDIVDVSLADQWLDFAAPADVARALSLEADGDVGPAAALLAAWLDPRHAYARYGRALILPDLVRIALAAADKELAQAGCTVAEADAVADPLPRWTLASLHCRAILDANPVGLEEATDLYLRINRVVAAAGACGEAAITYAHLGDIASARRCYTRASEIYQSLGAEFDLRRIADALRPYGIRRKVIRRPDRGWAALTDTERRIAALVADGLSNPEIADSLYLSRRTVSTHVSHILAKLDARRRLQIVHEVQQHQNQSTRPM
jgi:DNA-binding CsgD family transcriptional regulator